MCIAKTKPSEDRQTNKEYRVRQTDRQKMHVYFISLKM